MNTYYFADEYVFICHRRRIHLPSKTYCIKTVIRQWNKPIANDRLL